MTKVKGIASIMEIVCRGCGKRFDTSEITDQQRTLYGENICRECWQKSNEGRNSIDNLIINDSLSKEVTFSGHSQNYCICYVDVVNSTEITAKIPDTKISKYYTVFLNAIGTIARNFHVTIIKTLGDSLVCYFPQTSDSTNKGAFQDVLECCIAMIDAYSIINKQLYAEELPAISYRISADYGRVEIAWSSTSQGDDLFGSTMNLCVKINTMAEPNGIVIGGDLYRILKAFSLDADYHFAEVGGYSLGLQHQYPVYSLVIKKTNTLNPFKRTSRLEVAQMRSDLKRVAKSQTGQWQESSHKIMLVDDEPDILFVFKSILTAEGYHVDVFADSQDALTHFTKMNPSYYDLVITDIRMPGINGLQLCETLKAINNSTKVLFVSALDVAEELMSYLPGMKRSNVIRKPIDRENLVSIVKATMI